MASRVEGEPVTFPAIPMESSNLPDPTVGRKTCINDTYTINFKYPETYVYKEVDNPSAGQFVIRFTERSKESPLINLDIQKLGDSQRQMSRIYLNLQVKSSATINNLTWDVLESTGYCDAGECSPPFYVYQTIDTMTNIRYAFLYYGKEMEPVVSKILSVFQIIK